MNTDDMLKQFADGRKRMKEKLTTEGGITSEEIDSKQTAVKTSGWGEFPDPLQTAINYIHQSSQFPDWLIKQNEIYDGVNHEEEVK